MYAAVPTHTRGFAGLFLFAGLWVLALGADFESPTPPEQTPASTAIYVSVEPEPEVKSPTLVAWEPSSEERDRYVRDPFQAPDEGNRLAADPPSLRRHR